MQHYKLAFASVQEIKHLPPYVNINWIDNVRETGTRTDKP